MGTLSKTPTSAHCPICGTALSFQPHRPPFDAPCPQCGYVLWCYGKKVEGALCLKLVPGMTPEHADIERLAAALAASGPPHVVLDLSDVELIGSALTARLIALNKQVRAAGGRLVLCSLHRFVRETFEGSRLDRIFELADDPEAAIASF